MPGYVFEWVHETICAELDAFFEAVKSGLSPRLMLTLPPRHGKSELASRRFPAYVLGRNPDISIISTSYSSDLASRMNRDVQRIIDTSEYAMLFPDTRLSGKDTRTPANGAFLRNSDLFEIVGHKGVYRSSGVGGGITGMGADIAIIDDPFKDRASADSPTIRDNIWDWYTSTLYTRLAAGGGVLVINTRWHMDDLSGRLLEAERMGDGDHWRVVDFPAIATHDEPHRKTGEALSPQRFPLAQLENIKAAIGTRDWEALYQQHPTPDGGAIFKSDWIRFWLPKDLPEQFGQVVLSWDMTFKEGDSNDFVVGQVWGRNGGDFYLLDQVRGRWGFTDTVRQFRMLAQKWPQARAKLVEDKANGPAVIDTLKHEIGGIIPIEPDGSKTARAHAVTPLFESGNVYLPHPEYCPWVKEYIAELTQFPSAAHDDQCFAAGTKVATLLGDKPIEDIRRGDLVLTPFGYKRVIWSGSTGTKTVTTRFDICATINHPFIRTNGSIVRFGEIESSEECSTLALGELIEWKYRMLLCSTVLNIALWELESITLVSQKAMKAEDALKDSMLQFGSFIADRKYRKAMRFITRMAILTITTSATWSAYHGLNIVKRSTSIPKMCVDTSMRFVHLLLNGIRVKREESGIGNTHPQSSLNRILNRLANVAAKYFSLKEKTHSFAPIIAKSNTDTDSRSKPKNAYANIAERSSTQRSEAIEKEKLRLAAGRARDSFGKQKDERKEKVYNLTIEDCHLFYANGFLVHNCDATTQAIRYMDVKKPLNISPSVIRNRAPWIIGK